MEGSVRTWALTKKPVSDGKIFDGDSAGGEHNMRARAGCILAAVILTGCGASDRPATEAFVLPVQIRAAAGEDIEDVAERHGVLAADLIAWNGLEGDRIAADRSLLIWNDPGRAKLIALVQLWERPPWPTLTSSPTAPPVPVPPSATAAATPRVSPTPRRAQPTAVSAPAARPAQRSIEVQSPGMLAMLGNLSSEDGSLAGAAATMARHESNVGRDEYKSTGSSLGSRGTVERSDAIVRGPIKRAGPPATAKTTHVPGTAVAPPQMSRPAPKTCLPPPLASDLTDDEGQLASAQLSAAQINGVLGRFMAHTTRCFPAGSRGEFEVAAAITVGCNGQVDDATLVRHPNVPTHVVSCIEKTLSYANFPAHGLPGGMQFTSPLTYRF